MTDNPRLPIRKRLLLVAFSVALILQGLVIFSGSAQADTQRTRVAPFSETYYVTEEYTTTETYSIPLTPVTTTVDVYNYRTETYSIPLTPVTTTVDVYNYRTETYSIPLTPVTTTVDVYNYRTETYSIPLTPVTTRNCVEWITFWGAPACARWETTTTYVCQARGGCGPFTRQVRIAPFTETTTTYVCQARGGCGPFTRQVRIAPFTETTTTYVCQARGGCGPFTRQVRIAPFTETTTTYVCQARGGCGPFTRQVTKTRQVAKTREVFNYEDVPHEHPVTPPEDENDDNSGNYNNNEETSDNSRDDGDPCSGTWAENGCREVEERVGTEHIPTMGQPSKKDDLRDLLDKVGDQPGFNAGEAEDKLNELIADDDGQVNRDQMAEVLCAGLGISDCSPQELEDRGITVGTDDPPGGCLPEDRLDNDNCYDSTSTMSNDQLVTFISRTLGTLGNNGNTDIPQTCPAGWTGTYPNCVAPPQQCPAGWTGTYPNCNAPTVNPPTVCPAGWTGTPPNCVPPAQVCPNGWTGTYPNCEAPPQVSITDVTVDEDAGAAAFVISLSKTWSSTVSVDVATSDGTASAGSDYTSVNTSATISAGSRSTSVNVSITDDSTDESDETFTVTISNPSNATLGTASATGTITDDDTTTVQPPPMPQVTITTSGSSVAEDNPSPPTSNASTFTVSLDRTSTQTVTVQVDAQSGTATGGSGCSAGVDFTHASQTLVFSPGERTKTYSVTTCPDAVPENDENFTVTLSNPSGATLGTATASGTITDNDQPTPKVSLPSSPLTVIEGGSVAVTASLDSPAPGPGSVAFTTSGATDGGSACTVGADFYATPSRFAFAAGGHYASVTVHACEDADTTDEAVTLSLTAVGINGLALGAPTQVTVTVADNDCAAGEHFHSSDPAATGPYCHSDTHLGPPMCDANLAQTWRLHAGGGHIDRVTAPCPLPTVTATLTGPAGLRLSLEISVTGASAANPREFRVYTTNNSCTPTDADCAAPGTHYHSALKSDEDCSTDAGPLTFTSNAAQTVYLCTLIDVNHGVSDRLLDVVVQDTHVLRGHVRSTHPAVIEPPMRGTQ